MRLLRILALAALLAVVGCGPATLFELRVDFHSYIPAEQRTLSFEVPSTTGIAVYVLPGIQVDEIGAGPDSDMSQGSLVDVPSPPPESGLRLAVFVSVTITNDSDISPLSGATMNVVLAPGTSADVYADGVSIAQGVLGEVPATGSGSFNFTAEVAEGDSGYSILSSGSVRIGVTAQIDPSAGVEIPVTFEIQEVRCELTLRPYSLFRLLQ